MPAFFSAPLTGPKVLAGFLGAFGTIIAVNAVLATQAVRTFPGIEVNNSYVASQVFDADRAAQLALGWDVAAAVHGGELQLAITGPDGAPASARIVSATFGRATSVRDDQAPAFAFDGRMHRAKVETSGGNWNLRLVAEAPDGTLFRQRIVVLVD